MSALEKLQKVGVTKPYFGFGKLEIGYHEIERFRLVDNKFKDGEKTLLIELKEEVVFLPRYFLDNLEEEDVRKLNTDDQPKFLYFGGRRHHSK